MAIVKVLTDFDNTVTQEKGLEPFLEAYSLKFCNLLGIERADYYPAISMVRDDMRADPLHFGWFHEVNNIKYFSAPVLGDPVGSNTVAHLELMHRIMQGKLPNLSVKNIPADETTVLTLKEECYLHAYPKKQTFFRDGASVYLNSLANMFSNNAGIISNSKDTSIRKKLAELNGLEVDLSVIGLAQKMAVVSEEGQIQPEGFPVPINPDRPEYLKLLRTFHPNLSELAVIGDNFFLDIAAILLNGGYGVLLETEATQGYEIPFIIGHPRGHFAKDYESALLFLEQHRS